MFFRPSLCFVFRKIQVAEEFSRYIAIFRNGYIIERFEGKPHFSKRTWRYFEKQIGNTQSDDAVSLAESKYKHV